MVVPNLTKEEMADINKTFITSPKDIPLREYKSKKKMKLYRITYIIEQWSKIIVITLFILGCFTLAFFPEYFGEWLGKFFKGMKTILGNF